MELRGYLSIMRRRLWLVVACVILAGSAAYASTPDTPVYSASSTIYVGVRQLQTDPGELDRTSDILLSIERSILTFALMIDSAPTATSALARTNIQRSVDAVVDATTITPITSTQLIVVTVTDTDPRVAQTLSNAMSESFVENVQQFEPAEQASEGEIPSLPAYVFESARLPTAPAGTPLLRNIIVASIFGLLAAVGLAFLLEYLDITVKTAADAERRLELPVLGIIPYVRQDANVEPDRPLRLSG